jgi:hemerythrin-like domain-containing protein
MQPTEVLMQEHRVIEAVLDCLEKMAAQCEAGNDLDSNSASEAIEFFQMFADGCHHHKEEDCLFPLLESKGFSREQGPTGVMISEHETGRHHVRGMATATESVVSGNAQAKDQFVLHAQSFIKLLREHILKEDQCLFQMANQALSAEDQHQLLDSFQHIEHDDLGPGTHEKYLCIARKLAERYDVTSAAQAIPSGGSCCGH